MHNYLNVPRMICQALIGKGHQTHHRIAVGGAIMCTGVLIAQGGHLVEVVIFKATLDLIGYTLHGVGIVPFLEWLLEADKNDKDPPAPPLYHGVGVCPPVAVMCGATNQV